MRALKLYKHAFEVGNFQMFIVRDLQLEIRGEWLTLEFPFLTCSLAKKTIALENETWQRARQRLEVYNYGRKKKFTFLILLAVNNCVFREMSGFRGAAHICLDVCKSFVL